MPCSDKASYGSLPLFTQSTIETQFDTENDYEADLREMLQSDNSAYDALSCGSVSVEESFIIDLFCGQ